ncbi:MAG TPA: HAD hydrolase family protein [Bryobacterales bacterium]|nr:HAD hydrolase family protein [Bryobacterales bacterium]
MPSPEISPALLARASKIKLLLMDVDGVMTDGHLYNVPGPQGEMVETKGFDSRDGISLQWASWLGIETGVISGRDSPALVTRAAQCRMKYVYQGHIEKIPIYEKILADAGVTDEQTGYIGDDLTDAPILARAGLAAAPSNARPEVKRMVHFVTGAAGGSGAMREVVELILRAQGKWVEILRKYGISDPDP